MFHSNFAMSLRMSKGSLILLPGLLMLFSGCSKEEPVVEISAGEQIFTQNCKVCHAQGINGAPIIGNAVMWKDRKTQPVETLVEHAMNGYGLMPAKGGNADLTEEEIRECVKFMLSKLEQ